MYYHLKPPDAIAFPI